MIKELQEIMTKSKLNVTITNDGEYNLSPRFIYTEYYGKLPPLHMYSVNLSVGRESEEVQAFIDKRFSNDWVSSTLINATNRGKHKKTHSNYFGCEVSSTKSHVFMKDGILVDLKYNMSAKVYNITVCSNDETPVQEVKDLIDFISVEVEVKASDISIICSTSHGFYTEDFEISSTGFTLDNYNEDFAEVSDHIIKELTERDTGLVLLHGKPGTGKTSYIRHLITTCDMKMIYMPPDLSSRISAPEFVSFLMEHPDSVLIIEDAENIISDREAGGSQAVANLLNLSSGILGDALKIKIICTFNTSVDKIDQALRRKGRMIAEYEFLPLSENKTASVVNRLYGDVTPEKPKMTLAEIYGMKTTNFAKEKERRSIGFAS